MRALLYAQAMPPGQPHGSSGTSKRRLALGASGNPPLPRRVIGIHLQLTGYGHWLPNDPRGSNSEVIRKDELAELGPILPGRQRVQPSRKELKAFYREANELLEFDPFWFDPAKRQALADAFQRVITDCRYTIWACMKEGLPEQHWSFVTPYDNWPLHRKTTARR